MKKGQQISGTIERVDFPNKGILRSEEGTCVVKNALPGQKVTCVINKNRNGKAEGRLLSVDELSPDETEHRCPHFGECGGCLYMSLPYEKQLELKDAQMHRLLEPVLQTADKPCPIETIKGSPRAYGYRNKMEYTFGDTCKDGPLALGMHKRGSFYDIVPVTECQIADADYGRILKGTLDYFAGEQEKGIPVTYFHRLRHTGYLRHLLVRKAAATGEILVAIVTCHRLDGVGAGPDPVKDSQAEALIEGFVKMLKDLSLDGEIVSISHILNDSVADAVKSDETRLLYGRDHILEKLLGLTFRISTFSFFQTNSYSAEVLYETAREYAMDGFKEEKSGMAEGNTPAEGPVIYDLYSGTGTIAQMMAPVASKVVGVEIIEEAVEAAKENARINGLDNCEFLAGDVLKVLDEIEEKPDFIILDPPRDGVHPKALRKIIDYGVDHLVYISCKPTSLARDLEVFFAHGYEVTRIGCVDQFPATANVENIVLLSRKICRPDMDYIKIGIDAEEYYKIKERK